MGRGKVQLKKIENKVNRQVTFSKRKAGLLKKAHEISVLCESQVALIVFSDNGRLFEYSTDSNMNNILERYENYSFEERQLVANDTQLHANWKPEHCKLKARLDLLQRNHRHYNGEDLNSMNLKDLQNMEQQLETAIKKIRTRKNQLLYDTISDLQIKANAIHEQNNMLNSKIKEKQENVQPPPKEQQKEGTNAQVLSCGQLPLLPTVAPQLHCLDMGCTNEGEGAIKATQNELDLTLDSFHPCHLGYPVAR